MDQKALDDQIKALLAGIPTEADIDKMLQDIDNASENYDQSMEDIAVEDQGGGYKVGYDMGFVDGYKEGSTISEYGSESVGYNQAIDDIVSVINSLDFELKDQIVELIVQHKK